MQIVMEIFACRSILHRVEINRGKNNRHEVKKSTENYGLSSHLYSFIIIINDNLSFICDLSAAWFCFDLVLT